MTTKFEWTKWALKNPKACMQERSNVHWKLKACTYITEWCSNATKFAFEEKYPPLSIPSTQNLEKRAFTLIRNKHLSNSNNTLLEFVDVVEMSRMMSTSVLKTPISN